MDVLKHLKIISVFSIFIILNGCSLPMNLSNQEKPTEQHAEHWLHDQKFEQELASDLTAYLPLDDAFTSIAARLHLINKAKHNIDLQYYIWEDDSIGHLLLCELLKAADRGVKVRLLIDDQNGTKLDPTIKQLAHHKNFEIKLFNPYKFRHFRALDYAFRMKNINHRMHNKLIIADGVIAVTGGRNISREYFDASDNFQFTDMDILFYGTAVEHANTLFIDFWNDKLSYSTSQLIGDGTDEGLNSLRTNYKTHFLRLTEAERKVITAEKQINEYLREKTITWAKAHFIGDSPNKIRGEAKDQDYIYNQMFKTMGEPKKHMELVSAYFVPQKKGTAYLSNLQKNNVNVRVLTNSYLANDVPVVHAFYQKYRKELLQNGVKVYEFKPYIERDKRTWYEVATGNVIPAKGKNASRLHAKFFDIDGMVFIGSFNFDPRSAKLNTEVGLVVESDQLQNEISKTLDQYLPQVAYELQLNEKNEIIWLEHLANGEVIKHDIEPETTKFQRFMIKAVSILPIEWLM